MVICGLKITHDGCVALIDNGVLKFSIEMEKINNNHRYSGITDLDVIEGILRDNGYPIGQIDRFVVDGWHGSGPYWNGPSLIETSIRGEAVVMPVAPYNENSIKEDILTRFDFPGGLPLASGKYDYSSYMHVTGHVMSAYCTSRFAGAGLSSYVLTWDGGQYPRLYYVDAEKGYSITNLGHLFLFLGTIYSIFAQYFGPYKKSEAELEEDRKRKEIEGFFGGYSVAGKIMSYIALGKVRPELLDLFSRVHRENIEISNEFEHSFSRRLRQIIRPDLYPDEDVLATLHVFLERLLLETLRAKLDKHENGERNLCFAGGCALNIKWNSAIRNSGMVEDMYVPPFPNDSGSAIGAACCEYLHLTGKTYTRWSVYSGPRVRPAQVIEGWEQTPCTVAELAAHLHYSGEPVVFLQGAAELGPRALGHRSILAPAVDANMKDLLNKVKKREPFRPVAPICLEEDATAIFDPGCPDPYMLFDHQVREEWKQRIPAICHIDGTARLQTVSRGSESQVYALLREYKQLSGLPLLCNTSANLNGSGFFPDVDSAMRWGQLDYIWSDNILYRKSSASPLAVDYSLSSTSAV